MEGSAGYRRRLILIASLIANLGVLFFYKYFNFVSSSLNDALRVFDVGYLIPHLSLLLPLGLSFHTFQSMSYTIEVYLGRQKAERHLGLYALYVLFYPQLVAGPIERPQRLLPQFKDLKGPNYFNMTQGLRLMALGFFKKILIADFLGSYVNGAYDAPREANNLQLLITTYFFAVQIYCDFSGYSDIARGSAKVMGIELMKNFDSPYLATNIAEFWRRWHISLSTWFRDYLYIPLGGNRVSQYLRRRNLLTVFVLSGLWHGANWTFVVWGLLHGLAMNLSALVSIRISRSIAWVLTFHVVVVSWIFFRASSINDAFYILRHLWPHSPDFLKLGQVIESRQLLLALMLILGLFTFELAGQYKNFESVLYRLPTWKRWLAYYAIAGISSLLLIYEGRPPNPVQFIYFQF